MCRYSNYTIIISYKQTLIIKLIMKYKYKNGTCSFNFVSNASAG